MEDLQKKITLTLVGNKTILDELTPYDLEVVIDAGDKSKEWVANISKKNLITLNPEIDISKSISRVYHPNFVVRMSKLASEKIPIKIMPPIGESPRGYQFLDIWPYKLTLTISGPEEAIKRLKLKEQILTFNLNEVTKNQLDAIAENSPGDKSDIVSFYIPDHFKQVMIPALSDTPLEINDPEAKSLRIDFIHCDLLPIDHAIPIELFFPEQEIKINNPLVTKVVTGDLVSNLYGQNYITKPLYANGVDHVFLDIIKGRFQFVITVNSSSNKPSLDWNISFINPRYLEDLYVNAFIGTISPESPSSKTRLSEDYLRNRFRSYMQRFRLFRSAEDPFTLAITLKNHQVELIEIPYIKN